MTGYTDPTRAMRLKALGALATIEKPCSLDALLELVRMASTSPLAVDDADDFESLTRPEFIK